MHKLHYGCRAPSLLRKRALCGRFRPHSTINSKSAESESSQQQPLFQLGSLSLSSNVILSPLERVSDVGFRHMCYQNGAALTWTEMVYGSELVSSSAGADGNHTNSPTNKLQEARLHPRRGRGAALIDTFDSATPTGVQLLIDRTTRRDDWGVDLLQRCLEQLEAGATCSGTDQHHHWQNIVAIDLNFGCPSPSISRRGAGPAQLRRRSKIRALLQHLADWKQRQTSLPHLGAVGAKMRLGNTAREQDFKVYLPVAEAAAEVGLDYLTVHARHGEQRSSDERLGWECVREMTDAVRDSPTLKIIANGDIRTYEDVQRVMALTNCDGVMVGRAALRNPWCFSSLRTGTPEVWPTIDTLDEAYRNHCEWSQKGVAEPRYQRFREENFERLRRMAHEHDKETVTTTTYARHHCPTRPTRIGTRNGRKWHTGGGIWINWTTRCWVPPTKAVDVAPATRGSGDKLRRRKGRRKSWTMVGSELASYTSHNG